METNDYRPDPENGVEAEAVEFDLSRWISVVRRRRLLIGAVVGVFLSASIILYAITPRQYRATCVLQVERRLPSFVPGADLLGAGSDWFSAQSFYPTQQRILQSRGLAERVVRDLRLAEDPTFNPQRSGPLGEMVAGAEPGTPSAQEDAAELGRLAERLQSGVDVELIPDTRMFEVSYRAPTARFAAKIANAVADAYIDWGMRNVQETAGNATTALAAQIAVLKREVSEKETQLQAYSMRSDIVSLDPESNDTLQRLDVLNREYAMALSERITAESRYQEMEGAPDDAVVDTLSGGLVAQLRLDLLRMERDYTTGLTKFKPEWPAMRQLKAQIEKAREDLDGVIQEVWTRAQGDARAEYQNALRREESLLKELNRRKREAMELNSASIEYNNLKVEVSTRRALLDQLMQKQSQAWVADDIQDGGQSNVTVVDRALLPVGPYTPNLRKNLIIGLVLGLMAALGLVFLLEFLDRRVKSADDLERILGLPVLGVVWDVSRHRGARGGLLARWFGGEDKPEEEVVPDTGAPPRRELTVELLPHHRPRLAVSEAYRSLRTSLFLSSASKLKTLVVTSAISGEGKTATTCNLAVVLSQLGGRVLLVDADLRKPRIHEVFRVSNRRGLVNHLTQGVSLEELYQSGPVPNLVLLTAGPIAPSPSELLASQRMKDFVQFVRDQFDYVLFDTPPVVPVTDAALVGAEADGLVLCVGAGIVKRDEVLACEERLSHADVRILGAVLNRGEMEGGRGDYAYDAYGYGGETPEARALEDASARA